ncbi:MAG TPA: hypothetical protein VER38_05250 [Candidatus Eisenbacteria bacterium]|nr:hypothetical protein [Candidatus Eisenbacteria bacterium]
MQHPGPAAATRKGSALLPAFALTLVLTATTPGIGNGGGGGGRGDGANVQGLVREFNSICSDLQKARCDLQMRALDETAFGDRILELFVRADSITTLLDKRAPAPGRVGRAFALEWALRHLRESLRENYEGIVEGNGYRFVTADLAFKAAEAWRGSLVEMPASVP